MPEVDSEDLSDEDLSLGPGFRFFLNPGQKVGRTRKIGEQINHGNDSKLLDIIQKYVLTS